MRPQKTRAQCDLAPRAALPASRSELTFEHVDELSRRLRLTVEIDTTGWLPRGVELRYTLASDRSVQPTSVRVASSATFHELLADGGILERCARYNRALDALRALGGRAEALVQRGHTPHEPGSAVWSAQQELSNLDATLARRQTARMGHGVVTLECLGFEAVFLERYHQHLASIVDRAERAEQRTLCHVTRWISRRATPTEPTTPRPPLGHATIVMTMRYAHLAPDVVRDAVRLLDRPPTEVGSSKNLTNSPNDTANYL